MVLLYLVRILIMTVKVPLEWLTKYAGVLTMADPNPLVATKLVNLHSNVPNRSGSDAHEKRLRNGQIPSGTARSGLSHTHTHTGEGCNHTL